MQKPDFKFTVITVALRDILDDDYFQHRESTLDKSVSDLREKLRSGVTFDNIDLLEKPEGEYQIIAGFQQIKATRLELGEDATILARVYQGLSKADAMRISVRSNKFHGTPLSPKDRRNAVRSLLREDPLMTDAEIHDLTGASLRTVAYQRNKVPGAKTTVRRGRDGKFKSAKPTKPAKNEKPLIEAETHASEIPTPEGSDPQLTFGPDFFGTAMDLQVEPRPATTDQPACAPFEKPEEESTVPELRTLANICRMQAREIERRADFIEKLSHTSFFTPAELELIRYVAEDASALDVADSSRWDERSEKLKAVCVFLSELLATGGEEDRPVS